LQVNALTLQVDVLALQVDALALQVDVLALQVDALALQVDALALQVDVLAALENLSVHRSLVKERGRLGGRDLSSAKIQQVVLVLSKLRRFAGFLSQGQYL
jgi:hypothetical protein